MSRWRRSQNEDYDQHEAEVNYPSGLTDTGKTGCTASFQAGDLGAIYISKTSRNFKDLQSNSRECRLRTVTSEKLDSVYKKNNNSHKMRSLCRANFQAEDALVQMLNARFSHSSPEKKLTSVLPCFGQIFILKISVN